MMRRTANYALLIVGGMLFAVTCFIWAVVSTLLWPLLPARIGRRVGRSGAMLGFRGFLATMELLGAWRLDFSALEELRSQGPLIVAPNHPCLLDAVFLVSRMPDAVCVMKGSLLRQFLLAPAARLARYVPNDSLLRLIARAAPELALGGQLILFPEGTRSSGTLGPFTEAVGAISKRTKVPVQVVIIEASAPFLGKRWPAWAPPPLPVTYRARLGRRFEPPQDVRAFTEELDRHFRRELAARTAEEPVIDVVEDAHQLRG